LSAAPLRPVEALGEHHRLEDFASGIEALDRWLRQSARTAAAAGTAATYVLCRGDRVVGYYALAMSSVGHAGAAARLRRGMPDPVPVVLLARLALDRTERGRGVGGDLLIDALRRCVRGAREFGARAVIVDAVDPDAAAFYRHFSFLELEGQRLWRRISDIERALTG
jgi:predicted N-acetyltransferase YhbS